MISLNIIVDFASPAQLDRALLYLQRTQQKTVVIAGGAQMDRLMQYCERVRAALPDIIIMMRILEDTGIMIKLDPNQWYERYLTPRLAWLKAHKIVTVTDNETSGSDDVIRLYVQRSCAVADMLHVNGLNGVFCRFATGNIGDGSQPGQSDQYPLLKPLLDKMNAGDWIGPNEYSNAPGKSSGGHLERYKRIEAVAGRPLNMSIGEAGILVDYKSRSGYTTLPNYTDEQFAAQMLSEEMWYRGGSIPRHMYAIGGNSDWKDTQIRDGALAFWEEYYRKVEAPPVVVTPSPPVITPAPAHAWTPAQVADFKLWRAGWAEDVALNTSQIATLKADSEEKGRWIALIDGILEQYK